MTTSTRSRERLSVQVDAQLDAEIRKLAGERGCRVSDVVREALTTYVRNPPPAGERLEAPPARITEEWWQ